MVCNLSSCIVYLFIQDHFSKHRTIIIARIILKSGLLKMPNLKGNCTKCQKFAQYDERMVKLKHNVGEMTLGNYSTISNWLGSILTHLLPKFKTKISFILFEVKTCLLISIPLKNVVFLLRRNSRELTHLVLLLLFTSFKVTYLHHEMSRIGACSTENVFVLALLICIFAYQKDIYPFASIPRKGGEKRQQFTCFTFQP